MFTVIAGDAGPQSHDISATAAGLPGWGAVAHTVWRDDNGRCSVAARPNSMAPEDAFDSQPFVDPELVFVCRARLDNRAELLDLLRIDAARGILLSDSDLVRHAYRQWREQAPQRLYGDFAFVAWERAAHRVVAATDHIGTFSLFFCRCGARLLLSTRLSALAAHPDIHPSIDIRCLGLMAAGKLGLGWTMFEGIQILPGGELLVFQDGTLRTERWWQPDTSARVSYPRSEDYVEDIRTLFDTAVAVRLRARGGIVATMSGGLDSTLVAATAARLMARTGAMLDAYTAIPEPGLRVNTLPGWDSSDAPWAGAVANRYSNIRHRLVRPDGMTPLDILPGVHAISQTPIRNTANLLWSWQISALAARNRCGVVLCGDHGNLSISYSGDNSDASRASINGIAEMSQRAWDQFRFGGIRRSAATLIAGPRAAGKRRGRNLRPGTDVLLPEFRSACREDLLEMELPASPRDIFARALTSAHKAARPDFMAQFGVEWRDPTGDRRLLERLLTFPLHTFRAGHRPRGLARELGRGLLPESVRLRRSRGAQAPDEAAWFRPRADDYRHALHSIRQSASCARFLDTARLEFLLEALCSGRGSSSQAALVHRALDVGLFAVEFEAGTLHSPPAADV
jgi:asparagine synthase (glutamine-hydrolysing)